MQVFHIDGRLQLIDKDNAYDDYVDKSTEYVNDSIELANSRYECATTLMLDRLAPSVLAAVKEGYNYDIIENSNSMLIYWNI